MPYMPHGSAYPNSAPKRVDCPTRGLATRATVRPCYGEIIEDEGRATDSHMTAEEVAAQQWQNLAGIMGWTGTQAALEAYLLNLTDERRVVWPQGSTDAGDGKESNLYP